MNGQRLTMLSRLKKVNKERKERIMNWSNKLFSSLMQKLFKLNPTQEDQEQKVDRLIEDLTRSDHVKSTLAVRKLEEVAANDPNWAPRISKALALAMIFTTADAKLTFNTEPGMALTRLGPKANAAVPELAKVLTWRIGKFERGPAWERKHEAGISQILTDTSYMLEAVKCRAFQALRAIGTEEACRVIQDSHNE